MKQPSTLIGIDKEQEWIQNATELFKADYPDVEQTRVSFVQADAYQLPIDDNSIDVATCQTLLMHLSNPRDALQEMVRIVKPGGLVICVEPNNLFNTVYFSSESYELPTEVLVRRFEFWLRYQRGKLATGQGNHGIGDLLPGLFAEADLSDISVYQSDRAAPLFAPYESPEQKALLDQETDWRNEDSGPWDRDELRRCVLAGGATPEFFSQALTDVESLHQQKQEAIEKQRFYASGGGLNYLVSGRKRR